MHLYISNALLDFIHISKNILNKFFLKSWVWAKGSPGWVGDQATACAIPETVPGIQQLSLHALGPDSFPRLRIPRVIISSTWMWIWLCLSSLLAPCHVRLQTTLLPLAGWVLWGLLQCLDQRFAPRALSCPLCLPSCPPHSPSDSQGPRVSSPQPLPENFSESFTSSCKWETTPSVTSLGLFGF